MARVLVTRPEPGASRTARRLEAQGHQPVVLPLTETVSLPLDIPTASRAAAVAVTSANAVRHAPTKLIAALAALPCHAVGKRTADACRAAGFGVVVEGPGDADGLAAAMARGLAGKEIVYLCGRTRFPAFEARLAAAGVTVRPAETYETVEQAYDDADILARLSNGPVGYALLYSAKAATAVAGLAKRPNLRELLEPTEFLAISGRVADALRGTAGEKVRVAARPDEDALLALLPPPR